MQQLTLMDVKMKPKDDARMLRILLGSMNVLLEISLHICYLKTHCAVHEICVCRKWCINMNSSYVFGAGWD